MFIQEFKSRNLSNIVGIEKSQMDFVVAKQHGFYWCWAASIQMVLNFYGVDITQEEIVERTYGVDKSGYLPDWPANNETVHLNLNTGDIDNNGTIYNVSSKIGYGPPGPRLLIKELDAGRPIVLGYQSGRTSKHLVVITAVKFRIENRKPIIEKIIVRDPSPTPENIRRRGRKEWGGYYLAQRMKVYWQVRVTK